jgi:hypothetical protein
VVAGALVSVPTVLDVLADVGYGVISLPTTANRTLVRCAVIDAHQYTGRGYTVRKVGVRGLPEEGLHRTEWRSIVDAYRLGEVDLPELVIDPAEPLTELMAYLRYDATDD